MQAQDLHDLICTLQSYSGCSVQKDFRSTRMEEKRSDKKLLGGSSNRWWSGQDGSSADGEVGQIKVILRMQSCRNLLIDQILMAIEGEDSEIIPRFQLKQGWDFGTFPRDGHTGEKQDLDKRELEFSFGHFMLEIFLRHHVEQ